MKRLIVGLALVGFGVFGASAYADPNPPPNEECHHGNSNKPCREDPQPDHGNDCDNRSGGNQDHCNGTPEPEDTPTPDVTPEPTPDVTPTVEPTPEPTPESTPVTTETTPVVTGPAPVVTPPPTPLITGIPETGDAGLKED